ncbi:MAG TPA: ATP-binding protein, partial [Candidatus Nitrosotenuis sp.]|nr:ATP-binding protein [Candidatus Nitrosotenuis sp.]
MARVSLRLKAVLPVAGVLLTGLLLFVWVTLRFEGPERQSVITVAAAGAVAICAALLAVLAVLIQRPLLELQEKIARLREGDLNVSVSFSERNDEIGDLGRDFNAMVRQLRETREEIQRLHRTQMSRAEHLATLGELAAGLAHEIRNPLAGIAGVIEIIGKELPANSSSREVLKEVQNEVLHIKRILSDLLDYARPRQPDIKPADLNGTVEHAVALARQQALSRPVEILLERDEKLALVEHDVAQIQQVLLNLLLNSLQAIENSGTIRVQTEAREGCAVVSVADSGRGIEPQHLPNIFRPFFTTKGQGTGLGLSLAKNIVESHGGRIEVTSLPG